MEDTQLHQRLKTAVGRRTFRELGELTNTHPETVRRYMQGHAPSVEFVATLAASIKINGEWLLTGRGPMLVADIKDHALREANPGELLAAVAATLEKLTERVERIEVFLQTLELRLRVGGTYHGEAGVVHVSDRVRSVADALPQRTPPNDGGAAGAGGA